MRKFLAPLFISAFLFPPLLLAQPSNYLKLGINYASLRTEDGKSEPGLTVGLGKDFYPIRSFNGFFGFEASYTRKIVLLKDRNWPAEFNPSDSDIVTGDIKADISFLDLPLKLGYSIPVEKSIYINFLTGVSLSVPINNHTKFENRKLIPLSPEERGKFQFQYLRWEEKSTSISFNTLYGVEFSFKPVVVIFIYSRALSKTEGFTNLTVSDKLDSFHIALAYAF